MGTWEVMPSRSENSSRLVRDINNADWCSGLVPYIKIASCSQPPWSPPSPPFGFNEAANSSLTLGKLGQDIPCTESMETCILLPPVASYKSGTTERKMTDFKKKYCPKSSVLLSMQTLAEKSNISKLIVLKVLRMLFLHILFLSSSIIRKDIFSKTLKQKTFNCKYLNWYTIGYVTFTFQASIWTGENKST